MSSAARAGFTDTSPFLEVQARDIPENRLASEFCPTSKFWNLFTSGHQVLLGTRGSGKTSLIRMMSYGCLRLLNEPRAKTFIREKKFIGFYVPLHLEQMTLITQNDDVYADRMGYFKFIFNHIAASGFLQTVKLLLADCFHDESIRLQKEIEICQIIISYWYGPKSKVRPLVESVIATLGMWSYGTERWRDNSSTQPEKLPPLCKSCFEPITAVLPQINKVLGIDDARSTWVACVDEAEFLKEPFLKTINSFMRSQNRGLVVRLATAPFRYTTDTEIDNAPIEPNGNDFRYLVVDMHPDSPEFAQLCKHLWRKRALRYDGIIKAISLQEFLNEEHQDVDGRNHYSSIFGPDSLEPEVLLNDIMDALSPQRAAGISRRKQEGKDLRKPYINKYAPVFYLRRLKKENDKGNTNVGWFSGTKICLMVSEGNPRRFLDLMHLLYEQSRSTSLTPRIQQEVILEFCCSVLKQSDGLPEHGPLVRSILDSVLHLLAAKVHGSYMMNGGCSFFISAGLLRNPNIVEAIKTAIRFSRIVCDDPTNSILTPESPLRVSYTLSSTRWIPMREGDRPSLCSSSLLSSALPLQVAETPSLRRSTAENFVKTLELTLEDLDDEELPL